MTTLNAKNLAKVLLCEVAESSVCWRPVTHLIELGCFRAAYVVADTAVKVIMELAPNHQHLGRYSDSRDKIAHFLECSSCDEKEQLQEELEQLTILVAKALREFDLSKIEFLRTIIPTVKSRLDEISYW
jgi:hypothetical protein